MSDMRRRRFLQAAAGAALMPALSGTASAAVRRAAQSTAPKFAPEYLPSLPAIRRAIEAMSEQGPRYTGNLAHVRFVNSMRYQFEKLGLVTTAYEYRFPRWDAKATSLFVTPPGGHAAKVGVSSYYPRSGKTPPNGVTAPLTYGVAVNALSLALDIAGKIVYIDCPVPPVPYAALFLELASNPPLTGLPLIETRASLEFVTAPVFASLQQAGAVGAILGWTNISDAQAQDQYQSFLSGMTEVPALWIPKSQTARVRDLALAGNATATLTLDATITANAPTETIIAVLPGQTAETIIINTHTDGPNVVEENGPIALLAMARYFARLPLSARRRTLAFVLATGHMNETLVPSSQWMAQRPDIVGNAVAAVTVEHLGCLDWDDDLLTGAYQYQGRNDFAVAQTDNTGTAKAVRDAFAGTGAAPTIVAAAPLFFGVGSALNNANIPTVGFIMGPAYLLTGSPDGEIDKVSFPLLYAQLQALTQTVALLDGMTAREIAGARLPLTVPAAPGKSGNSLPLPHSGKLQMY